MISKRDFNLATARKRSDMARRLRPVYWKSGKRCGQLRKPGRELPFTLDEFRAWAMKHIGFNAVKCFYCPRMIDILHFEADHFVPLDLHGSIGLDNIVVACEDCNRMKGSMPPEDFIKLIHFLEHDISMVGCADAMKRLKAGAMGIRLQYHLNPGSSQKHTPAAAIPKTRTLDFEKF